MEYELIPFSSWLADGHATLNIKPALQTQEFFFIRVFLLSNVVFVSFLFFLWVHMPVSLYVHTLTCGGRRSTLGIIHHETRSLIGLEFAASARLAAVEPQGIHAIQPPQHRDCKHLPLPLRSAFCVDFKAGTPLT